MKPIATSLPTTIEEFQLALEAAFAGGQTLGKALANADKPAREPLTKKQINLILGKQGFATVVGNDRRLLISTIRDVEAAHGIGEKK